MNATLRNEARPVLRQHRGVLWCPFCDRSRQPDYLLQAADIPRQRNLRAFSINFPHRPALHQYRHSLR